MGRGLNWTDDEIDILKNNYNTSSIEEMLTLLPNRTKASIVIKASSLELNDTYQSWSDEEKNLLKEHFPNSTIDELCALFPNRKSNSINGKARDLELKKSSEHMKRVREDINQKNSTWTNEEDEMLKKYYPNGGYKAVLEILPHKNERAIVSRASRLEIKVNDRYGHEWNREVISVSDIGGDRKVVIKFTKGEVEV